MSISNDAVFAVCCVTLGSVFCFLCFNVICCYPYYLFPLFPKLQKRGIKGPLSFLVDARNADLENQAGSLYTNNASNVAWNSFPLDSARGTGQANNNLGAPKSTQLPANAVGSSASPAAVGGAGVVAATDANPDGAANGSPSDLDFKRVLDNFDKVSAGVHKLNPQKYIKRMSTIQVKKDENNHQIVETYVGRPSESQYARVTEQFDTLSRTLFIQNMLESKVKEREYAIREVRDPFLTSHVTVGGIVVVVKPFHGANDYEFSSLYTGDLLRIIKFYIREDDGSTKPIKLTEVPTGNGNSNGVEEEDDDDDEDEEEEAEEEQTADASAGSSGNGEVFIDKTDPNYGNIYCTGILLNTYLNYNAKTKDLSLQLKKSDQADPELLKDFPLSTVSLETTVLKKMYTEENAI